MSKTPKSVSLLASLSAEVMPFGAKLGQPANVSLIFNLAVSSTIKDNVRICRRHRSPFPSDATPTTS